MLSSEESNLNSDPSLSRSPEINLISCFPTLHSIDLRQLKALTTIDIVYERLPQYFWHNTFTYPPSTKPSPSRWAEKLNSTYLFIYFFIFHLFSAFLIVPILHISYKWNHTIRHHSVWLLPLTIMFSRLISDVACIITSFIFLAKWYPIEWIYHILFIHSPVNGHLFFSTIWLWWLMLLWIFVYKFLCKHVFSWIYT